MRPARAILETVVYIEDIDAAEAFYRDVFGLECVAKLPGKFVFFRCGAQMLLIFNPVESARADPDNPIPRHGAQGAGHFCFAAADAVEIAHWRAHFERLGIVIERDHIWDGSGAQSLYIRDPGGNSVEVAEARLWDPD